MRTSIRDVAARAGVSPKTVTNVLRGRSARTSEATRTRVHEAVAELNYIPVSGSAQNRHVETRVIGLVFDQMDEARSFMGSQTYLGLRDGALQHGYDLLTLLQKAPEWAQGRPESLFLDRRCDGYIFVHPANRFAVLKTLVEHRVPTVTCYNTEVPKGVYSVTLDNAGAMVQALRFLMQKGHARIAHLQGMEGQSDVNERAAGFSSAVLALGLKLPAEFTVRGVDTNGQFIPDAVDQILALNATAVVCDATSIAMSLRDALEARGLAVPGDLSITGIDDNAEALQSGITALTFSCEEIGRVAIEQWMALAGGGDAALHQAVRRMPVHLLPRASVASPRGR